MDEQAYYEHSLQGLEAIAQYQEAAAEQLGRTADASEHLAGSVSELIKEYQKENTKKSKNSGSSVLMGGSVSDILNAVRGFDDKSQAKADAVIDFFSKFHTDVIGKYTGESTDAFNTTIDGISNNILTLGESLSKVAPYYAKSAQVLPMVAHAVTELMAVVGKDGKTVEEAQVTKIVIETMANNVLVLGQSLARSTKFYKAAEPAIPIIGRVITNLISTIHQNLGGKDDLERAMLAAQTIEVLSRGIFGLSKALAISAPLMVLAIPGAAAFSAVMRIMSPAMNKLAMNADDIREGSRAMRHLSLTMLMFSGSMALSAMVMSTMDAKDIPKFVGLFAAMGVGALVYNQIGKHSSSIIKGSLGVMAMSGATLIFAKATHLAVETVPDPAKLALLALEIGGMALVYGLIGNFSTNILMGSLSVAAMGLSLMILSKPLGNMADTMDEHGDMLWKMPVMLTGLATVYAAAGIPVVSGFIMLGAASFAAIGGSLILLSSGVKKMTEINMTEEQANNMQFTIQAVVRGFAHSFRDVSVKEAATLPLKMAAIAGMGASLAILGMGVGKYKQKAGDWDEEDSDQLVYTISSLSQAFATAGSTDGQSKLFGFNVGKNDTQRGIDATMKMGRNLRRLASGISEWKEMDLTEDDMQLISDNVMRVLTTIPNIFAAIGKSEREDSANQAEILGVKFGIPFTKTDTELGIQSTMKMGKNLKNLADGIRAWKDMPLTPADLQIVSDNITRVLTTIPNVFAAIGKSQREDSANQVSFLGMNFGVPFTKTDVELGVESTMKIGENLKTLSDGVMSWADFDTASLPQIQENILSVLGAIPSAFAAIGKEDRDTATGALWWKKGDVERGAAIFDTIGPTIKSVADLVMGFKDVPDVSTHAENIGLGISTILGHVAKGASHFDDDKIKILEDLPKPLSKLTDVFKDWSDIFKDFMDLDFAKVEEAAVLAIKLDRIQKGLYYEDAVVETDEVPEVQEAGTYSAAVTAAAAATAANPAASTNQIMAQLLTAINQLQQSVNANTNAVSDIKEQLVAGTIKTKDMSNNEF